MAIFISKRTPWKLSDVNSGYTCLGGTTSLTQLARPVGPIAGYDSANGWWFPIEFSSAGNLVDVVLPITNDIEITNIDRSFTFCLMENIGTTTVSIANPAIITKTTHGLSTGDMVSFSTTGTMPTISTVNLHSVYVSQSGFNGFYVEKIDADTFYIHRTYAEAIAGTNRISTSGSQSGTHTLWKRQRFNTLTSYDIRKNNSVSYVGTFITDVPLSSPLAVTTGTGKYNIGFYQGTGTSAFGWAIMSSGYSSSPTFQVSWLGVSDTLMTPTSGADFLCVRGQMEIDMDWTTKCLLQHIGATNGYCGWVVPSATQTFGNDVMMKWTDSPAASYTFTVESGFYFSPGSGFQVGSALSPMPYSKQAIIDMKISSIGTPGYYPFMREATSNYNGRTGSVYLYGEIMKYPKATLAEIQPIYSFYGFGLTNKVDLPVSWAANDVLVSLGPYISGATLPTGLTQGTLYMLKNKSGTTYDLYDKTGTTQVTWTGSGTGNKYITKAIKVIEATDWVVGNRFSVGLQDSIGSGTSYSWTIGDITADGKNFSHSVPGRQGWYDHTNLNGANVLCMNKYGISIKGASNGQVFSTPGNHCYASGVGVYLASIVSYPLAYDGLDKNVETEHIITDCTFEGSGSGVMANNSIIPMNGIKFQRLYGWGSRFIWSVLNNPLVRGGKTYTSGTIKVYDSLFISDVLFNYGTTGSGLSIKWEVDNVEINNSYYGFIRSGVGSTYNNFKVYGSSGSNINVSVIYYLNSVDSVATNDYVDRCNTPYYSIGTGSTVLNTRIIDSKLDTRYVATTTGHYGFNASSYSQNFTIENTNKNWDINTTNQQNIIPGATTTFLNWNSVANDDRNYYQYGQMVRTGTGLGDTTARNSGFAMRFQSNSGDKSLQYTRSIPTGNIQNKVMTVGVWCKINSANYWAGTNQMPRLSVNYDNGTIAYSQAAQSTDWQFLTIPFEPTTTYGEIQVTFDTRTDALTTDAYVYFDDFSTLLPAGVTLSLGNFDLWSGGSPIAPYISTTISAQDVWSVPLSTVQGVGTTGKKLSDDLTTGKFIALK